jgi:hypothetical protein
MKIYRFLFFCNKINYTLREQIVVEGKGRGKKELEYDMQVNVMPRGEAKGITKKQGKETKQERRRRGKGRERGRRGEEAKIVNANNLRPPFLGG